MRADMAQYHVMAVLEIDDAVSFFANQPDLDDKSVDGSVTTYDESDRNNRHSPVLIAAFQAIIRNKSYVTAEAQARTLYNAVDKVYNRAQFNGFFLTGAMSATSDPVIFAPDDGAAVAKATLFTVGDYIMIEDEILIVTDVSTPNVTASRAALGTTKAAHLDNAEVFNITQSPIPGESCDHSVATQGVQSMGQDVKLRWEFSVNWAVTMKPGA